MKVDPDNGEHLFNLYKELKDLFPNSNNIVTLHNKGVLYSIDGNVRVMPTINVGEVDRTAQEISLMEPSSMAYLKNMI